MEKAVKDRLVEWLRPAAGEILAISLFTNLLALAVPLFSLQVYDRVIPHHGTTTLVALAVGMMIALLFEFMLRQLRARLLQGVATRLDASLGRSFYTRFTRLPLATLEAKPTHAWHAAFSDIAMIRSICSGPTAILVADLPFALLFVLVIFIIALPVGIALTLILPLFILLALASTRQIRQDTAHLQQTQRGREGFMSALFMGRSTLKTLDLGQTLQEKFESLHAHTIRDSLSRGMRTDFWIALSQSLSSITTVLVIGVGAVAILERDLTTGALIASTMLSNRIIGPVSQLVSSWRNYASAFEAIKRLDGFLSMEPEKTVPAIQRPAPKGSFAVERLHFHYNTKAPPVLNNLHLTIQPGDMLGVVGRNGCGKTTLLKMLQGLYTPSEGRILLDGIDLAQLSRAELAAWIGYVPQETFLFPGTIRDNIAIGWKDAPDDAILKAAKLSAADQFIAELPDGFATDVGEGGSRLSGGQRQRIAIARALLKDPAILIADEISSHLDSQVETALRQNLLSLAGQKTLILATHSPLLLSACKHILVMDRGQIALYGPAADVLPKIMGKPA